MHPARSRIKLVEISFLPSRISMIWKKWTGEEQDICLELKPRTYTSMGQVWKVLVVRESDFGGDAGEFRKL
jgi:hypothetical protein